MRPNMKFFSTLVLLFFVTSNVFASYVQAPQPIAKGGTGATTKSGGFDALSPMTTSGDLIYGGASGTGTRLAKGSDGQVLTLASGLPAWSSASAGTVTSVSVSSANGFAGTVATATTTPAITISTSVTGLLEGNGTSVAAATNAQVVAYLITGFSSSAGTVSATDSIVQAIGKLDGNTALKQSRLRTVTNGGNTAYQILGTDDIVRTGTTLTAGRAYTLDVCNASNIGEVHYIKNTPAQTFAITLTASGSDNIDGASTYVLNPGDDVEVACDVFSSNGTWDIL